MNHDIKVAVVVAVSLDEMIAAAESAHAADCTIPVTFAANIFEFNVLSIRMRLFADVVTAWNLAAYHPVQGDGIENFGCRAARPEHHRLHTAADVNTHKVRHNLVGNCHRSADCTARANVHIGHQPNPRALRKLLIAKGFYLRHRHFVHIIGEHLRRRILSNNFFHYSPVFKIDATKLKQRYAIYLRNWENVEKKLHYFCQSVTNSSILPTRRPNARLNTASTGRRRLRPPATDTRRAAGLY